MALFCGLKGSLMAVVLCFASLCDQLQNALSISRFQLLDDNRPSHKNWSERKITIKMPGTHPLESDTYLCTAVQLSHQKEYIVEFQPSASQHVAHHMLLFGCKEPGSTSPSWDCNRGPHEACSGSQEILYAWAKDAPSKYLPKDVGFAIGGDSDIKYLVLQVHYANVDNLQEGEKDYSGFILHTRRESLPYLGGIYLMWAYRGAIPKETSGVHVDVACHYKQTEPMHAFAFRTHAHRLGKVITGYRIRNGIWTLLGKGDPQAPQAFYPMKATVEIRAGDILAARCTYDSTGYDLHKTVHMGASSHDEMCNFYIMYFSNAERLKYSGGNCGEQDHPEIFGDFPPESDTPLKPIPSTEPTDTAMSSDDVGASPTVITHTTKLYDDSTKSLPIYPTESVQVKATELQSPELQVVSNWPNLTALENSKLGQVTGVAVDSKGQVVVFHRGSRIWDDSTFDSSNIFRNADLVGTISEHTVWILDSVTGKVKAVWGKELFYLPHGLTIDHGDNLWVTDVGSHQVFKFSPLSDRTQRLLSLGDKLVPGADNSRFCKPTAVAVDKTGEFFVADGYCNSRIMKFSSAGKLLNLWGKPSYSSQVNPALGAFLIPHSLSLDGTRQRLFIADRENGRVQVMDSKSGAFIDEIKLPEFGGLVYAVDYSYGTQGGVLYVVNGPANTMDQTKEAPVQGFTIRVGDKTLLQTWPSSDGQGFSQPHALTSSGDGTEVYVVEISPNRIWKLRSTVPSITKELLDVLGGSGLNPKQVGKSSNVHTKASKHGDKNRIELVEKAKLIPLDHQDSTRPNDKKESSQQAEDGEKPSIKTVDNNFGSSQKGGGGGKSSSKSDQHDSNSKVETVANATTEMSSGRHSDHQDSSKKDDSTTGRQKAKSQSYTPRPSVEWINITQRANSNPEATPTGSSKNGPKKGSLGSDDSDENENDTKGVIPALVILSILAVPIVFLLLISIVLRIRAFHRDRNRQMKGFHSSKDDLSVGTTRGWLSYMNCFDRQRYKFSRVTLSDFYSDSDSDGV